MKYKLQVSMLKYYLLIFVFLPPQYFYYIGGMSILTSGLAAIRYVISFFSIAYFFANKRSRKWLLTFFVPFAFFSIMTQVISMILNGSFYLTAGLSCVSYMGFLTINIIIYQNKRDLLLAAYRNELLLFLIIHFITLFVFPNGMVPGFTGDGKIFFMGNKNVVTTYVLLVFVVHCLLVNANNKVKKGKNSIEKLACVLTIIVLFNGSSTAILSMVIIDAYLLMDYFTSKQPAMGKLFQRIYLVFLLVTLALFFYIVIISGGGNHGLLGLITRIFGRDVTFSGRRAIWAKAAEYIAAHPIWGMGIDVNYDVWGNNVVVKSAHNMFLDYGVKYGCISLLLFLISIISIFILIFRKMDNKQVRLMAVVTGTLIFGGMFEAIAGYYTTWIILLLVYINCKEIKGRNNGH